MIRQFLLLIVLVCGGLTAAAQSLISLEVDATNAPRNLVRVRERLKVSPGKLELYYPKWIPGEHAPTGPINDVVNFFVTSDGRPLNWQRDNLDMFAFQVEIPAGTANVEVSFDYVSQPNTLASARLARLKWNRLVMAPRGAKSDDVEVTATLVVPNGWKYATALQTTSEKGNEIKFKPVSLTTFVDSPAIIGEFFQRIPLGGSAPVEMSIAADEANALKADAKTVAGWKKMVTEAELMFGGRHYDQYKFLLTLSDYGGDEGLEHHESSEDGVGLTSLSDSYQLLDLNELLGHEFVHSWNGKFRRPRRLTTPDFEIPMQGDLLWVYEGLTQYLGRVLPTRAGLWSDQMFRETVADTAAMMDYQSGRRWRPLVDTARAVEFTYPSPRQWMNARRRVDYYYEGALIWMEADVLIRQRTNGAKSLDDFLNRFHGGGNTGVMVKTYEFEDVINELNQVLPYDWRSFFTERVYKPLPRAPLGGIIGGGWQLVYDENQNRQAEITQRSGGYMNLMYSIGAIVNADGEILDVNPDLAAFRAGLAPGMSLKKVNGDEFTIRAFYDAVKLTKTKPTPIVVEAENAGRMSEYRIEYTGGHRFPHLVRDPSKPDFLTSVTQPRTK